MPDLPIFMDNHSTTRVDPRVFEAMLPFFDEKYGNAASVNHSFGWEAADAVEVAREQISRLLNTTPKSLVFTSGATESNNIALKGVLWAARPGSHMITTAAEHRSVLDPAKRLARDGYRLTVLPVDEHGLLDAEHVAAAIKPDTVLVSVILANNEVGSINSLADIASVCRDKNVLLHTDAVQALGKIPLDLDQLQVDLASVTAHKLYGPKGIGALFVRRQRGRVKLQPLFDGGGHERGIRSGTLPVPLIAGFGSACELAGRLMAEEAQRVGMLRDRLWEGLRSKVENVVLNGHPQKRLAGNLNVSFKRLDGEALMTSLKNVAVSSGSACTSAAPEPSHVLRAMGRSDALTRASLRFGLGRFNTQDEVDYAIAHVADAVCRLRKLAAKRA